MPFPVPKDVRAPRPFELVRGMDEMIRDSRPIADLTQPLSVGEWVKLDVQGRIAKLVAADTLAAPAAALVCWTLFVPGNSLTGQADVLATSAAEVLRGPYGARTQLYDPTQNYLPEAPLVAVYDAVNNRGILAPLDPATATTRQLACVVAYVVQPPTGGQLEYASTR